MGIFSRLFRQLAGGDVSPVVPGEPGERAHDRLEARARQEALGRTRVWLPQGKNEPNLAADVGREVKPEECGRFEFEIVGEASYQRALWAIVEVADPEYGACVVERAYLVLDDNNPYDANAVRVDMLGRTVGHLAREKAVWYRRMLAADRVPIACHGRINGGFVKDDGERAHLGVKLDLKAKRLPRKKA